MNIPYRCDLFLNLEKTQIDTLFKGFTTYLKTYKKDEIIFKGDEYINELGIILKGKVIIGKETSAGNKTIIAILGQDDFIG
ncbi:MAG: cyclic nucleotide-binding domain-containing protein, partial [Fusobacteria bacterium]|nr:cyclic nucleotide-binding domain-containing protein [Fusobacteriota bacterium]